MEIIKFRIYDPYNKRMLFSGATPMMLKSFFESTAILNAQFEMPYMQYTCIRDEKMDEIYEGDLLRFPAKDNWEEENYALHEVFFHDNDCASYHIGFQMGRTHYHGSLSGGCVPWFLPKNTAKMRIIGNIYENKDLLSK